MSSGASDEKAAADATGVADKASQDAVALSRPASGSDVFDEKALLRKMDMRLIPWLCLLYLLSFLDRTSIGNAKLYDLETDLHMTDPQYLIALTVFFISYSFFEVPSNVLLKRLKPSIWLSFLMLMWGIMMTVQGLVHNFAGLTTMRWFLGMFEAGLFPGVAYYLSSWYKRREFGIRLAIFFTAATVSGAFGGLLAFGISHMNGVGGKAGWAWIFIIEGLLTVMAGAASFWIIQDFPETAKFLTPTERAFVIRRLQEDQQFSAGGEGFNMRALWQSVTDWKTYFGMLMYACLDGPLYAFALFSPTIVNQLGFTANRANLLTVPVFVWAGVVTVSSGFWGDRYGKRSGINVTCFGLGIIGSAILIASRNAALSYVALYIMAAGIYPLIPNTAAWIANNVEGSYKRGVTIGFVVGCGNLNGVVSSNIYRAVDAPWFRPGHSVLFGYFCVGFLTTIAFTMYLKRENARRERGVGEEIIDGVAKEKYGKDNTYESIDVARREKGDMWSGFRYVL